jgi:hypothetical protein
MQENLEKVSTYYVTRPELIVVVCIGSKGGGLDHKIIFTSWH